MQSVNLYSDFILSEVNKNTNNISKKIEAVMLHLKLKTKKYKKFQYQNGDSEVTPNSYRNQSTETSETNETGTETNETGTSETNAAASDSFEPVLSELSGSQSSYMTFRVSTGTNTARPIMINQSVETIKPRTSHFGTDTSFEVKRAAFQDYLRQSRKYTNSKSSRELGNPLSLLRAKWYKDIEQMKTINPNDIGRLDDRFEVFKIPKYYVNSQSADNYDSLDSGFYNEENATDDHIEWIPNQMSSDKSDSPATGRSSNAMLQRQNNKNHSTTATDDACLFGDNNSNLHHIYNGRSPAVNNSALLERNKAAMACLTVDDLTAKIKECAAHAQRRENNHKSRVYPFDFCRGGTSNNQANSGRNRYGLGGDLREKVTKMPKKPKVKGFSNSNNKHQKTNDKKPVQNVETPPGNMMMCMPCMPTPMYFNGNGAPFNNPYNAAGGSVDNRYYNNEVPNNHQHGNNYHRGCGCHSSNHENGRKGHTENRSSRQKKKQKSKDTATGCLTIEDIKAKLEECQFNLQAKEGIYESSIFPYDYCDHEKNNHTKVKHN